MEIIQKKSGKISRKLVLSCCIFLLVFFFSAANHLTAAGTDSTKQDSAQVSATADGGPSLNNISKNLQEVKKMQEKQAHDEFMSYIYMGVGFAIVIAIAWFTTSLARKRKKKEDEVKALRLQHTKHHHDPRKAHHPKR